MFAKRVLQKAINHHHQPHQDSQHVNLKPTDMDPHVQIHFGIPNTASILAIDPVQRLLAVGTLDGRIKVIGGYNIEALLTSPKEIPYKNLEFMQNQGYLFGVLNDNDIQVWNVERRCITCSLQWEYNIMSFSALPGSPFVFVGNEYGIVSVLKYDAEDENLEVMPYHISPDYIHEKTGISLPNDQSVVGVLPQPSSLGNRLLIAYQYGLFILWDVLESNVIVIKGDKNLLIKDHISDSPSELADPHEDAHEHMNEKEISALCWASSVGSMLAVGYIDGDILLWNIPRDAFVKRKTAGISCDDVVKLQLSSEEKRLPVIYLCWGENSIFESSCGGQLFVYGGCEIGSEEVITVVSLQWSPGMEVLKSVRRVDFSLIGAFADMVSLSSPETAGKSHFDGLFVLTRPGNLQFYSTDSLCALVSQHERKTSVSGIGSPVVVPTSGPQMTAAILSWHPCDGSLSMWLSEMASAFTTRNAAEGKNWPLTGGVWREISSAEEDSQKIIYIVGYQDGSVRIWDATTPIFPLVSIIEGQVNGIAEVSSNVSVTKLDFCASMMNLAVGTRGGEVRVYCLSNDSEETKLHRINHSERIVYDVPAQKGPQCRAVFTLVNSPVQSLQLSASGAKLAVGFENGHVAVLDMISLSVLFSTDSVANSNLQVVSVNLKTFSDAEGFSRSPKHSESENIEQPGEELLFTLTLDAKVNIVDSKTGSPIGTRPLHLKEHTAISMYVLDRSFMSASPSEHHEQLNKETKVLNEPKQDVSQKKDELKDTKCLSVDGDGLMDSLILLCCETTVRLYNTKSVIQGEDKPICKVKLSKPCSWTTIFREDGKVSGLFLVYQSGAFEVRSLPNLELLAERSLISVLRWNMRLNMKLASSTDQGLICLTNGSELAFISLSNCEIRKRFLESLPSLHDKDVAAAADAAMSFSLKQKKQVSHAGIIGDIVKGFKKEKSTNVNYNILDWNFTKLDEIFSRPVEPDSSVATGEDKEEELDIDDIEIDEPVMVASTSSHQAKREKTKTERDKLFDGAPADLKPRTRTPEEIMAKYKGPEYAAAAAERAKNKLVERQEKLEKISQRTEDLRDEAENFASMANELVRTMERKKKWWKI